MEKVKITKEQANTIERLKKGKFNFKDIMALYISQTFGTQNTSLLTLSTEELAKALLNGYEIELPPAPEFNNNKLFIGYHSKDKTFESFNVCSIQEAKEIADTLYALVNYYEKFVNQNDNNGDKQ
jgi:hypothetical protein